MNELAAKSHHAYFFKEFTVDLDRDCLWRGSEELKLRPKVFEALSYLVVHNNRLVTKDELIKAIWTDTFVTDDSLVQCLVELRRALGDEAQACIKTVPRRGYIFTAEVRDVPPSSPAPTSLAAPAAPVWRTRPTAIALVALAVATVAVSYVKLSRRPPGTVAFTEKDSVLIADFANTTGDEVFDGTLRQALAVQLEQSPFLNIFSEERIRETLRYMGRSPGDHVTREVAREIAQRQGVKAFLAGSIASLGRHYVINLEAVNAATGEVIVREQVEAESRETVLRRLGEAATRLREELGESIGSIDKFAAPIEQATTGSLEAFKAYDLGRQRHFSGQYFEAIPLYRRAVELDPDFAIAYAALGVTYGTAHEDDLAAQFSQRAFELRERVSERERFYISARYYMDVLDDGDRAIEVLELWKQTYPRDFVPRTNLAARYCAIGRHERALEEAREGVRLNPDAGVAYAAVAHSSIYLQRYRDARAAIDQALARKLEPPYGRYMLYGIAFLEGDTTAMQQQVDHVAGTPTEAGMLALQSQTAAYGGHVRRARALTRRAIELATSRGLKEGAGLYSAGDALWEAAYGNCRKARQTAARTLAMGRGRYALSWSALAMALCGESSQAQELAEEMVRRFPQDSFFKASWLPMVHAAVAIDRDDPARAVELLQSAARAELGGNAALWPAYLRGLAYLDQGAGNEARAEFQKILDHKGVLAPKDFNPVAVTLYPLASIGRARAAMRAGDMDESRKAYEELLALWKDADPDIPVLRAAQREYRQLAAPRIARVTSRSPEGHASRLAPPQVREEGRAPPARAGSHLRPRGRRPEPVPEPARRGEGRPRSRAAREWA
jgi:DNA-binding winged helix-turn-helix (wHTH) protein/tetratricopeptide (TPR) repeat protein